MGGAASTRSAGCQLRIRPASTASTASSSGTHSADVGLFVGARVGVAGRDAVRGPRTAISTSSLPPGDREEGHELAPLVGDEVGLLGELALRGLERLLPSMSSSPAGISQSRWRIGCRYCWISRTRSSSSIARIAAAPGWSTYWRTISPSPYRRCRCARPRRDPRTPSRCQDLGGSSKSASGPSVAPPVSDIGVRGVLRLSASGRASVVSISTTAARPARRPRTVATPRWRSSAAPTSPRNSGCGRFGRERSSGCACVAM